MRVALVISLALAAAACGSSEDAPATIGPGAGLEPGQWELGSKSGLCVAQSGAAGLFIDSESGANCMAQGTVEQDEAGGLAFVPRGDDRCRIPIEDRGQSLVLGDGGDACRYYCGGEADYAGRELVRNWEPKRTIVDVAGDPLC